MKVALASCTNLPGWEVDDLPLVAALEDQGAVVHTPAWTEDIDWNGYDITVIRTTWDYHAQKDEFISWCRAVPRLFNNANIVAWNTHKSYLKELELRGVQIAPTRWITKNDSVDIKQVVDTLGCNRGFIKPQVGACASDTLRFAATDLQHAQTFLDERSHMDMMVQPYLNSVETEGELTAVFIDGTCTHGVQKIPVKGDYRVQDDFGASDHPYEFTASEITEMERVLLSVPDHKNLLYARIDYLRDGDGTLLLNELELIEPSLFFRHCEESAILFAEAIIKRAMMVR